MKSATDIGKQVNRSTGDGLEILFECRVFRDESKAVNDIVNRFME